MEQALAKRLGVVQCGATYGLEREKHGEPMRTSGRSIGPALLVAGLLMTGSLDAQESGAVSASSCGTDAPMVWGRVVLRRMCRLLEHPEVKKATGATDPVTLLDAVPDDIIWRISDRQLIDFYDLFVRSMAPLDADACATLYPGAKDINWSQSLMAVASVADSGLSERWGELIEAWVWIAVRESPLQPEASPEEVTRFLRSRLSEFTAEERADIAALDRGDNMAEDRACRVVRRMYQRLPVGPEGVVGPALRTLMRGELPWSPPS